MNKPQKMAAFLFHNMPQNAPGTLTAQDAYDVAAYIHTKPRPKFNPAYKRLLTRRADGSETGKIIRSRSGRSIDATAAMSVSRLLDVFRARLPFPYNLCSCVPSLSAPC
jgi:hypothetical protein